MVNFIFNARSVLITGATGFLGSHLVNRLCKLGFRIIILKRSASRLDRLAQYLQNLICYDLENTNIESIFKKHSPELVLHCATDYGRDKENLISLLETNLIFPMKLMTVAEKYQPCLFINTDTILDAKINAYALSKKQFFAWLARDNMNLPRINIVLDHFFGPFDSPSKFYKKIINDLLDEVPVIDLTPGQQKRDFIYIDDVVDAFLVIINYGLRMKKKFKNFQIGSNQQITIKAFIENIQVLTGNTKTHLNFGALPYRKNEIMEYSLDSSALQLLSWSPKWSLEKGLKATIQQEIELRKGITA